MRAPLLLSAQLILAIALLGCTQMPFSLPYATSLGSPAYSQEELREELRDFASRFQALVGAATDRISDRAGSARVRKQSLLFKVRVVPLVRDASLDPNPQESFVRLLTLMALLRDYVTTGAGSNAYAADQQIAVDVTSELYDELVGIGEHFLGPKELEQLVAEVEEIAGRRPIGSGFSLPSAGQTLAEVESTGIFARVADVPLAPFRALGGVGDSPAAIREFTATARDFVRILESLPEQARWQVELMLFDAEERQTVVDTVSSLQALSSSATRVSESVSRMPDDLRALLQDSDRSLARLDRMLERAQLIAGPLEQTAKSVELASASWSTMLEPSEEPATGRPFDIREWESAAREFGHTTQQLQLLAAELRELGRGDGALPQVAASVDLANAAALDWIDQIAWRVFQLLVAFFLLLSSYRFVSSRLARR